MTAKRTWHVAGARGTPSAMERFLLESGFSPDEYEACHRWSVSDPGAFWCAMWSNAEIIGTNPGPALDWSPGTPLTDAVFFPEARLNFAENLLRQTGDDHVVIELDETGAERRVTADQLRAMVARFASGLRAARVHPGDRVATILPNRIECLVSLLGTATVGAVWTSCSPDFGAKAIIDRIGQVGPKVLVVGSHYHYGGRDHDIGDTVSLVIDQLPEVERVVHVGPAPATSTACESFDAFGETDTLRFHPSSFNDPLYILYTSGTTGPPKAILHRTGGPLLQQLKEHRLHGDLGPGDRFLWYTNTAWMMYHWLVAGLGCGASIVLYDGAPILKTTNGLDCSPLWDAVSRLGVSHLGVSPRYLGTLQSEGFDPKDGRDLASLRWVMAAGAPVPASQFEWVYDMVGPQAGFASISGGTELMGCFLLGSPLHDVRAGELTTKGLGMAVEVHDGAGRPVVGQPGALVCTAPFPSMPLTFWGPDGDDRYHHAYFADRSGVWDHGDLAEERATGGWVIHGRADSTLNPGGVRIGASDIYATCDTVAEIDDSVAFARPIGSDEEIVLCVALTAGVELDARLAARIRSAIRAATSPRHVPAAIYAVAEIPYTLNGKRVEGAARAAALGQPVTNLGSLANPDALTGFARLSEEPEW